MKLLAYWTIAKLTLRSKPFLNEEELVDATELISNLAEQSTMNAFLVMADLVNYRCKNGSWAKKFIWESTTLIEPLTWRKGMCSSLVNE